MRLRNDAIWVWGRVAAWALKRHIATELRPWAAEQGLDREIVLQVAQQRLRAHFNVAWPHNPELSHAEREPSRYV